MAPRRSPKEAEAIAVAALTAAPPRGRRAGDAAGAPSDEGGARGDAPSGDRRAQRGARERAKADGPGGARSGERGTGKGAGAGEPSGSKSPTAGGKRGKSAAAGEPSGSKGPTAGGKRAAGGAGKGPATGDPSSSKRAGGSSRGSGGGGKGSKRSGGAKRPGGARRSGPPRGGWGRWLLIEALVVLVGVAVGLAAAGAVLWTRAERDIDAWVASPPRPGPTLVLSAPMRIAVGDPLDLDDLASDLLAAGFERGSDPPGDRQFFRAGDRLVARAPKAGGEPWAGAPGGLVALTVRDGRVAASEPSDVVLPPTVLARLGDLGADRARVPLAKTGPHTAKAVLAMEDARFRDHAGVDPIGVFRAALHNATSPERMHGGSTLTQQLAKNLFLTQERTARRKVREVFAALALERRFTKDELLELYLDELYLGQVGGVPVVGVERAARAWFGVSAERLTLRQSAVIAGVISAPNAYSPARHPERAAERADLALDRMRALGWADDAAVAAAKGQPILVAGLTTGGARLAPWAVDAAVEQAERSLGPGELTSASYRVHTTIQPHLQRAAERAVRAGLGEVVAAHPKAADAQAALVAVRASDGAIVAIVGSRDYAESPYDRATHAEREVGSTVKPLTLTAALDADPSLTGASTVVDEPISRKIDGKPWTPKNYDGAYVGEITLRAVVEQSRNVPAVKMAEHVGPTRLQRALRDLGLARATNLPSAALGAFPATPLALAGAYAAFPNGGDAVEPRLVEGIRDAAGRVIVRFAPQRRPVVTARAAAMATAILQGVLTDGTARGVARYGVSGQVGGKTGTTNDGRDAWLAGVTPGYAIVAWVGRDRGAPLGLGGGQAALPIWGRFVADGGVRGGRFPLPKGLVTEPVCRDSGKLAREACPRKVSEVFVAGQVPRGKCDEHGGPVVEATGFLRRLFSRPSGPDVEGEGAEATVSGD